MVKILCAENTWTIGDWSHKILTGESGLAGWTDTLNPNVTDGDSADSAVVSIL